jgi:rhamnosyltransferase
MDADAPRPRRATLTERIAAVARLGLFSGGALRHVLQKLGLLTFGAAYVSDSGRRLRLAFDRAGDVPGVRAAIVAHAFYPDLIGEILRCRGFLPGGAPLFITVPPEKLEAARAMVADAPAVTLIAAPNRGRDIAPFLAVLSSGLLDPFDAVLKIHTKRSPHLLDGEIRRKLLFDKLCGSRAGVRRVLDHFRDPTTGMVGWGPSFRTATPYWMENRARVETLALSLGIKDPPLGFFEGSMFWFRPSALAGLKSLDLGPDAFESEAGQVDGTLHHAVERLFTIAAWASSHEVRALDGRRLDGEVSAAAVS